MGTGLTPPCVNSHENIGGGGDIILALQLICCYCCCHPSYLFKHCFKVQICVHISLSPFFVQVLGCFMGTGLQMLLGEFKAHCDSEPSSQRWEH